MTLQFTVVGVAQQMGSKKAFVVNGHAKVTDSNRNLKEWQRAVRQGASEAMLKFPPLERRLLLGEVRLTVAFYLPRPKSLPKKILGHTKAPDLDKLVRGTQDALTQIVFRDDSQVVDLVAMKRYAPAGFPSYATVRVDSATGVGTLASQQPLFAMVR